MSLRYLLDGYNIVSQIPQLADKKLEQRRECLIRLIERHQPQGSLKNTVTIVFDGQSHVYGSSRASVVKIIFTSGESADDKIKSIVKKATHKKNFVVVTDDRDIKYFVRALGAVVISVRDFLSKIPITAPRRSLVGDQSIKGSKPKNIPRILEQKINSEFADIWLKKKGKTTERKR